MRNKSINREKKVISALQSAFDETATSPSDSPWEKVTFSGRHLSLYSRATHIVYIT